MSDDAMDSMDAEDTEEEIFENPRKAHLQGLRTLRSHTTPNQELDKNNSRVRRSTRNKSQTYDNLNTSWIFGNNSFDILSICAHIFNKECIHYSRFSLGTQTLKGYPMYKQHDSSSDKEMVDEEPPRTQMLSRRMTIRSRENHPPNKTPSRHLRAHSNHNSSRELRVRPHRLRERSDRERDRSEQDLRERPNRERALRERPDRERELRSRPQLRDRTDRDLRDRNDRDIDLRALKERQDRDRAERDSKDKTETKDKSDSKTTNNEKESR